MSRTDTSNEAILNLTAQLDREETTQFLAETLRALLFDREMLRGERDSARMMAEDIRLDMQGDMSSLELTIAVLQEEREELRAALERAIEYVDLWSCYAAPVYQEKHDLEGNLRDLRGVLEATKR